LFILDRYFSAGQRQCPFFVSIGKVYFCDQKILILFFSDEKSIQKSHRLRILKPLQPFGWSFSMVRWLFGSIK